MKRLRGSLAVEFVMIVVGVLLALAADSALERRRLREDARGALEALRQDIQSDVIALESYWEPELSRQEHARTRLAAFLRVTGPIVDSVQFVRDVGDVASYATLDANTSAIEELKNSGGLSLIGNRALRTSILDYLNSVENIAEFDVLHRALFLELYAEVATQVVRGLALPAGFEADNDLGGADAPERARRAAARALDAAAIRSAGDLEKLLAATGQPFLIKANQYRALHDRGVALLAELDDELGRD